MSQKRDDALAKVKEAQFFLDLMKRVEDSQTPSLKGYTAEEEYNYYLDGFWNACYSATHYFDHVSPTLKKAFKDFREKTHADFYAYGTGLRSKSVHDKPVTAEKKAYHPPNGNSVNFDPIPSTPPMWNEVNWVFKNDHYFPSLSSKHTVTQLCEKELSDLDTVIRSNCP